MITFSIKMRKLFFALIPILLATVSCNSDSGNYDPVDLPAYTVMIYAQGGGLDNFLFETVKDLYNYGSTDNVNVTMQIKMSEGYQAKTDDQLINDHKGIVRYVLPKSGQKVDIEKIGKAEDPFSTPDKLKEFILWSKEKCPARNYILVMWGHGTGWNYESDCTKACLPDDNRDGDLITNVELARAIRESGVHIKALDFYCCCMARMETIFEFGDTVDYLRSSNEPITGNGHETAELVKLLDESLKKNKPSDELIEGVWTAYLDKLGKCWEEAMPNVQISAAFTDLRKLQPLMDATKEFKDLLISSYSANKDRLDAAACACYRCNENNDNPEADHEYDVVDYALQTSLKLMETNPELSAKFAAIHEKIKKAAEDAEVYRIENGKKMEVFANRLSYGILLTDKTGYEAYQQKGYQLLSFEARSGWSQWLKVNEKMPVGNPCPFAPLLEDPFLGDWEAELGDGWISHVTFEDNQDYKEYEYEKSTPESRRNVISGKWYYLSDTKNTYNIEYEKDGELKYRTITIDVNEERTVLTITYDEPPQYKRTYKKV